MLSLSSLSVASLSLISGIIITIISLGGINASSLTSYSFQMPGMMGTNMMGTQNMMTTQGQLVSVQHAIKMMHNKPTYGKVNSHDNTIIFGAKNASIVALTMMSDDAVNITGTHPSSYSKGDVFVISGLINPTLVVPKGATVQFTVINLDEDMYHNLAISSVKPPYPYMAMMSSMNGMMASNWKGDMNTGFSPITMSFLPPTNHGLAHEYSYTLTFGQSGNLWYLCTYPSHAQDGMYGKIVVAS
ncbi:MAG: plastocyanin/azurin family copper-binding protein [Candidatus Nitrosopolaris sp.]